MRRRTVAVAGIALVLTLAVVQAIGVVVYAVTMDDQGTAAVPAVRDVTPYERPGAWVDVYDIGPDGDPPVTVDTVDEMADAGVRTLFLQVARDRPDAPERTPGLDAPRLAAAFLLRAHERGMRVVAWYLPRFGDVERDLAHLRAMADFEVQGHRFDGIALDIEWTGTVPDADERSRRLVELSQELRRHVGQDALGAIVMPPVHLEVVNPGYWPRFPWDELAPLYDVWLPMGYWTDRTAASGYRDAATYTSENLRLLRGHLGDDAPVHAIGGLGEGTTPDDLVGFVGAVDEGGAIGASIYDWATFPANAQRDLSVALDR
jgi:hypothetical protein